jgi:Oxygenase domain of the 2OGFeDO superfamily
VQEYPRVSASFRSPAALDWLDAISESNAIFGAILAVIHPTLYDAGWQTTMCLRDRPEICPQDIISKWATVFTGVAVISNRSTPKHRDGGSRCNWYDILATLGNYRDCNLELPGLGVSLEYGPGTVVGISGMMVAHEASSFKGDRLCHAYFMRDDVHEWANVPASDWMSTRYYEVA